MQELLDEGRQLMEADGVDRRDADRAADDLLHLLQLAQEFLVLVQDFLRRLVHPQALARELELLLAAIDQQRLEMPLHRTRLLTDGGLCDAVQLGRFREALGLDQVGENFEILHLHG